MISYEECQLILKKSAAASFPLKVTEIGLDEAVGRVLAEDLIAIENNPTFDNSAMDGYAIQLEQLTPAQRDGVEWVPTNGLIAAGDSVSPDTLKSKAVEIMTGAPIPGTTFSSVVRVEDTEQKVDASGCKCILLKKSPMRNDNIRRSGEDICEGDRLFNSGMVLQENHLLVLATQGISKLRVRRKVGIGILSTGKELVDYQTTVLKAGQIRNSTGIYLENVLKHSWSNVANLGIVEDNPRAYRASLLKALDQGLDVIVSTGAVSMGVFDFVRPTLEEMGAQVHFHKCAIRPGKPILFATINYGGTERYIFGIPGNPVSTAVGYNFFVKPFLEMLCGVQPDEKSQVILANEVKKPKDLRCFFKAKLLNDRDHLRVEVLSGQASFMVSPLIHADAWVILPEDSSSIQAGQSVEVLRI